MTSGACDGLACEAGGHGSDPRTVEAPFMPLEQKVHCYVGVAALYSFDKLLAVTLAGVGFPHALIGLFCIVPFLLALSNYSPGAADRVLAFFKPGVEWVAQRWLPLFYIPALVTLPLAVKPLSGEQGCLPGSCRHQLRFLCWRASVCAGAPAEAARFRHSGLTAQFGAQRLPTYSDVQGNNQQQTAGALQCSNAWIPTTMSLTLPLLVQT